MIRTRPPIPRIAWLSHVSAGHRGQTRYIQGSGHRATGRSKSHHSHWTGDKLSTTEKYPLSLTLSTILSPKGHERTNFRGNSAYKAPSGPSTKGVHIRTQLVSPDLCDDVLAYAGQTLDQHKGCDILDINPGTGLWSQKLHDYLKPRSHVLVEPKLESFKDFLNPLLAQPDSKYSLWDKDPCDLDTYRSLIAEGAFPHQRPREGKESNAQEVNNSLLVTGSLMWDPRLPGIGFDSMAKQLFHHFASSTWTNDLFHAFGTVRMLLWVQHEDFGTQITESINGMQKANRFLEMTHQLNVIVNPEYGQRPLHRGMLGRDPRYTIESTIRALKSGREKGMELPARRRDHIHDFAEDIDRISEGTGATRSGDMFEYLGDQHAAGKSVAGLLPDSAVEMFDIAKSLRERYPDLDFKPPSKGFGQKFKIPKHPDPAIRAELNAYYKKRSSMVQIQKTRQACESIADIGEQIYNLEIKILGMEDGTQKDAAMKELEELDAFWSTELAAVPSNYRSVPETDVDDRISLRTPPYARIQWDARSFEPLIMRPSETWPRNRVSLVDAMPLPRPVGDLPDQHEWLHDFIFGLFPRAADPIDQALDRMQHGLSDILNECPSLKDPAKGGRLQMKHFRVRMLTMEMIAELAQAYRNWPFKAPGSDHKKFFWNKGGIMRGSAQP